MYHNMYNSKYSKMQQAKETNSGYVRVLHAVPDAPNVDIYADEQLIANNLAFGEATEYLSVPTGTYKITLYVAGTKDSPVLSNMYAVKKDSKYTIAAAGTLNDIGFVAIPDSNTSMEPQKAMIRFAHLSPNAPAVDITLPDGTVIFKNVAYKQMTPYVAVDPMDYTLQVRLAGTPDVVLTVPDINLSEGKFYTVYAAGLVNEEPELQALLLTDY